MQFIYDNGVPTVEQAVRQGVSAFAASANIVSTAVGEVTAATLSEIRAIFTTEMATLFDPEAVAIEWNQAVEKCIELVEGTIA